MDFFVDGGLQQLFSDLDESEIELTKSPITITCNAVEDHYHYHYQSLLPQEDVKFSQSILNDIQMYDDPMTTDELLQENLDFLLSATFTQNAAEDCTNFSDLYLMNTELSDWEDKFLDNFIEIPELSRILPDETPLCTENCVKFLQESSENLRLLYSNQQQKKPDFNIKDTNRIYTCHFGECRKIYAKSAHLKAHLRRHLGDKPFVCTWPQCNWKFSRSDELARHKRSHSGIKPYCCDFCNKCFARSDHLTKHRKVHEKRLLAASRAGKTLNGVLPPSILTIRPGRKKKNQL